MSGAIDALINTIDRRNIQNARLWNIIECLDPSLAICLMDPNEEIREEAELRIKERENLCKRS